MDRMNTIKWVLPIATGATGSVSDRAIPLWMASSRWDSVHPVHPVFQGARGNAR